MISGPSPLPSHHLRAELALLGVTVLWGTSFTVIRLALEGVSVWQLLALRFTVAAVIVAAWRPQSLRLHGHLRAWLLALWLGAWLAVGYVTQSIGLVTTTAPRSAFITSMAVIFVPPIQILVTRRIPSRGTMIGIALSVVGLAFLCNPFHGEITPGDLLTLACAIMWSVYIVELGRLSGRIDLPRLVLVPCLAVASLCWGMALGTGQMAWSLSGPQWLMILHLGLFCTFVTTLVQSRYQRDTTPTRAALIFCAEPVFAALFAAIGPLHETLGLVEWFGAVLILAGIVVTEVL
ncbi:MAG: DMT family transporter [Candidatus Sumerlaeia bacterium]|nr:DMT family transporter [Candidatus Sumerlaeia bacterium]